MSRIIFSMLSIIFASCSSGPKIFSDHDRQADFSLYKSYMWLDSANAEGRGINPLYSNELIAKRIKTAVDREMVKRGFSQTTNQPDLVLHFHIMVEDKTATTSDPHLGNIGVPVTTNPQVSSYHYREGTLIIDLMNSKTNELVWRGWATDVITDKVSTDPEKPINSAIEKIFAKYPGS